jgi:hypothetical protein
MTAIADARISHLAPDALVDLVVRVAAGDRLAFAKLHAATSGAAQAGPDTFVEVWWMARFHCESGTDVAAWITGIARRRGGERLGVEEGRRAEVAFGELLDRRTAARELYQLPRGAARAA